ncbi:MAG: RagB/SusD family nutrient uptake outer membrane protein [Proteiniphilum sp.]|jgi:hypothetical protein|nr:RagB/SusD family nutrient uptake outer membrane protein [Proteiniphilum sp.]
MKRRYLIILLGVALAFNACNDWLDVSPRSEIRESELFLSEDGYKHALTGAYILIAQQQLYGKNASMYIPEALSRHWTTSETTSELYRLMNYEYTYSNVESLTSNLWLNYYKVIAQLNNILENIETSDVKFQYNNDRLIKGEALGLRAFLHLEVLRLFGPVPDIAQQGDIAIPYVTELTKDPNKLLSISYSEVLKLIEADLNAAEKLLEIDPLIINTNWLLNRDEDRTEENYPKDSWQLFRQARFNYYAVLGTKARFYHWAGNKPQAAEYAKKVIEAVNDNDNDSPKFTLANETSYSDDNKNMVMYSEHLFGIQNSNLRSIISPLFIDASASLTQAQNSINTAYEISVNPDDIRRPSRYWEYKSGYQTNMFFLKYSGTEAVPSNNRVPLLRLSELYLILIEDLSLEEAKPYFSAYRTSRSMNISVEETSFVDENARLSRLEKEYRKEFYGEGQMFFFYKKHNYESFTWPAAFTVPANGYVIPKPKSQLKFE